MGLQDVTWTMALVAPFAGVVAVAALALLHEDTFKSRRLGIVQLQQTARRADSGLLADYLADGAGTPPARVPLGAAAMARRADPDLLHDHLAERRKLRRPFRRRVAPLPRSRPTRPSHLVPLSA